MLTTPPLGGMFYGRIEGEGIRSAGTIWVGLGTALRALRRGGGPCAVSFVGREVVAMLASLIVERVMPELTAYSFKLRKNVVISDPKLVILKNGRPAVRGVAQEDPNTSVFRIVSAAEAEKLRAAGITEEES